MEVCSLQELQAQLRIDPETSTAIVDALVLAYRDAATDKVLAAIGYDDVDLFRASRTRAFVTIKAAVMAVTAWLFENRELSAEDFPEANLYCLIGHLRKL